MMTQVRTVNKKTMDLIESFESLHRVGNDGLIYPYHDMLGYPTIGIGHLLSKVVNENLSKYPPITKEDAYKLHTQDVNVFSLGVSKMIIVPTTDNQFGAIVSLAFNVGLGNLKTSTLIRKLNQKNPISDIANEFLKWNKGGGKIIAGLTRRRIAERELFLKN